MYCGEKIRLRAYKEEDIPLATKFVNDRELKKLLVTNIPFPMTNWEEESWIKSQKSNDNGQYNFAIEDIETGKYIGGCGIQNVNWLSRVALVGIMIGDKDYWGKGYGTDAMKTLVTFIFNNMNINKIRSKRTIIKRLNTDDFTIDINLFIKYQSFLILKYTCL